MLQLKPCPFCGNTTNYCDSGETGLIGVGCSQCTAAMVEEHWLKGDETIEEIQTRLGECWNRRNE